MIPHLGTVSEVLHSKLQTPGDNRAQGRWWTQLIFPVSGCDSNALVRVLPNPFPAFQPTVATRPAALKLHDADRAASAAR